MFLIALAINVNSSLKDPFSLTSLAIIAQTSGGGSCSSGICHVPDPWGPYDGYTERTSGRCYCNGSPCGYNTDCVRGNGSCTVTNCPVYV